MHFVLFLLIWASSADLPVHCPYTSFPGTWHFFLNSQTFTPDLHSHRTRCGHTQPNEVIYLNESDLDNTLSFPESYTVELYLTEPNTAISTKFGSGHWTAVYDEGLEVRFGEVVFFAHSLYLKKEHGANFESRCDRTMMGWYRGVGGEGKWGCFYGVRVKQGEDEEKNESKVDNNSEESESSSSLSFLQIDKKYEDHSSIITIINK